RRNAVEMADKGLYSKASVFLRDAVRAIDEAGIVDPQLADERSAPQKHAATLDEGAAAYNDYSRKLMSTQAYSTMSSRHEDAMVMHVREKERENERQGGSASAEGKPNDMTINQREESPQMSEDKYPTNDFYDTPGSSPVAAPPEPAAPKTAGESPAF